jgi:hypothetical protein
MNTIIAVADMPKAYTSISRMTWLIVIYCNVTDSKVETPIFEIGLVLRELPSYYVLRSAT